MKVLEVAAVQADERSFIQKRLSEVPGVCSAATSLFSCCHYIMSEFPKLARELAQLLIQVDSGHSSCWLHFLSNPLVNGLPVLFVVPDGGVDIFGS